MTQPISRRRFTSLLAAAAAVRPLVFGPDAARAADGPRLKAIVHHGPFILDCPLPGETRADNVVPAHPNGLQLSRDRFLVLYATRGFRGIDDDRSICYQLRRDSFTGPVLAENFLARSIDHWDATGDGKKYFKQHGHPVAFGVPAGAVIGGKTPAHAGVFVAKWRTRGITIDEQGKLVHDGSRAGQGVEWAQFRLNASGSDIELIQRPALLRQVGYESGPAVCPLPKYVWMNQAYVNAVPYNADASEWVDANHFAGDRIAALRYAFNPKRGLYDWVQTSGYLIDPKGGLSECSVVRWGNDWLLAARLSGAPIDKPDRPKRGGHGVGWLRTADLFSGKGELAFPDKPNCQAARSVYRCPDGALRVFGGDATVPPNNRKARSKRNPIYAWDINPDKNWEPSAPRMIYDAWSLMAKLPGVRPDCVPMVDMIKLMSPLGSSQTLLHRFTFAPNNFPPTPEETALCGMYHATLEYDGAVEPTWRFS